MAKRKYTGWDQNASGRRAGTERLIELLIEWSGGAFFNNGSWLVRAKRGKSSPSVHGTGRAFDLSWRGGKYSGSGNYQDAERAMAFLVEHADVLLVEAVFDYYPSPYGRGWKCNRDAWTQYRRRAFSGAPGGDWFHVEIANDRADDPAYYERVFAELTGGVAAPAPAPAPAESKNELRPYPGKSLRRGSQGADVKWMQAIVGTTPDGDFGRFTERAVKRFQSRNRDARPVDGIVGKITWAALQRVASEK